MALREQLLNLYRQLLAAYGPQHWWPADPAFGPFEVMVGAILTQAAAWGNVEKAIANLKEAQALTPAALREMQEEKLARLIYPSGYYQVKARKLKALASYLVDYDDDFERLFTQKVTQLRGELLSVYGIGPETADSILLYAGHKPIFVIDAYTFRLMPRLGLAEPRMSYHRLQALFMEHLPSDAALFNEYHALIVRHGKEVCRKNPLCGRCPLRGICPFPA